MSFDVVIVGGGPSGLSAALALGRARRRVLLCDSGPRRNAAASHVQNFVTRDGTPPGDFRGIARHQLAAYPNVEVRDESVVAVGGAKGAFEVRLPDGTVRARRVLLCTGLIDEMFDIDGFRELWGRSIFQCPYCHGWEAQDRVFGVFAHHVELLDFALLMRGWTSRVTALTGGGYDVPAEVQERLAKAGVQLRQQRIAKFSASGGLLQAAELADGTSVPLDVLFSRPPQRQVPLVDALGVALTPAGYVQVHDTERETSVPGIYAGGDLVTPMQGAIFSAASGTHAAAKLNHELMIEMATNGQLA